MRLGVGLGISVTRPAKSGASAPLDRLTVSPVIACGLRRLAKGYVGPAMRVRRSTDGTESAIGFTDAGALDVNALLAFAQGGSAWVTMWMDQVAGGLLLNGTAADQPRIVDNGVLDLVNVGGRPGIRFLGAQTLSSLLPPLANASEFSVSTVCREMVRQQSTMWLLNNAVARAQAYVPWSNGAVYFDVGGASGAARVEFRPAPAVGTTNAYLFDNSLSGDVKRITLNGAVQVEGPGTTAPATTLVLGGRVDEYINAVVAEFLVFPSALSAVDRATLQEDQARYYGIG